MKRYEETGSDNARWEGFAPAQMERYASVVGELEDPDLARSIHRGRLG